jgi:hypothetical protein
MTVRALVPASGESTSASWGGNRWEGWRKATNAEEPSARQQISRKTPARIAIWQRKSGNPS